MLRRYFLAAAAVGAGGVLYARTPENSARVGELIRGSTVVDMLGLLTLNWPLLERWQTGSASFGEAEFRRLRGSGIDVFHPAVAFDTPAPRQTTLDWFAKWNRLISNHPAFFRRIDNAADLKTAKAEGKVGIILGMQDANHIDCVEDVDRFYQLGQRLTQITYNSANRLGCGCLAPRDRGLTEFGADVIARMNANGMAVDVSHCGQRTTLDAIAASKKPVLITHSNCRALAPGVARCKTDEAIKAAAAKGGVIGITHVRHFVRSHDPVSLEDALDHFDYAVKLVGVEHVGVGSDLDLEGRDRGAAALRYDIAGLNRADRMFRLTDGLIRRGYTGEQIRLLLGGNFQRALAEIWT